MVGNNDPRRWIKAKRNLYLYGYSFYVEDVTFLRNEALEQRRREIHDDRVLYLLELRKDETPTLDRPEGYASTVVFLWKDNGTLGADTGIYLPPGFPDEIFGEIQREIMPIY